MTGLLDQREFWSMLTDAEWESMPYEVAIAVFAAWQRRYPGRTFGSAKMRKFFPDGMGAWPEGQDAGDDDRMMICCRRAAELAGPYAESRQVPCNGCGRLVWLARSTPIIPSALICCTQCVARMCIENVQEEASGGDTGAG